MKVSKKISSFNFKSQKSIVQCVCVYFSCSKSPPLDQALAHQLNHVMSFLKSNGY